MLRRVTPGARRRPRRRDGGQSHFSKFLALSENADGPSTNMHGRQWAHLCLPVGAVSCRAQTPESGTGTGPGPGPRLQHSGDSMGNGAPSPIHGCSVLSKPGWARAAGRESLSS